MNLKLTVIVLLLLVSCSLYQRGSPDTKINYAADYKLYDMADYLEHFRHISDQYLENIKGSLVQLKKQDEEYLYSIVKRLKENNELLFTNQQEVKFYIVKHKIPFYFSTPDGRIFATTAIFTKYVKNEDQLASVLVTELIRVEKYLYRKNIIIPTGNIDSERMLLLCRLSFKDRMNLHKWSYYALMRAGIDSEQYLAWLQVQNRNTLDFLLHLGDSKNISREETLLKAFMIKHNRMEQVKGRKNSSKNFYDFVSNLREANL